MIFSTILVFSKYLIECILLVLLSYSNYLLRYHVWKPSSVYFRCMFIFSFLALNVLLKKRRDKERKVKGRGCWRKNREGNGEVGKGGFLALEKPSLFSPPGLWFPLRPYVLSLDSSSAGWEWKRSFTGAKSPKRHTGLAKKLARIFLYPLMEKPNQLFGQPNPFVTTAPRPPGLPGAQNALRPEGREDKRSRGTRKKRSVKRGRRKERKGWDWSFYFKIQPVLTALDQLELVGLGPEKSLHLDITLSLSLLCNLMWLRWGSKWLGSREGDVCLGYIPQGSGGAQWTWGPRPCPAKLNDVS